MSELSTLSTVSEVAAWLGWTEAKLRNRITRKHGHPPYVQEGRSIMFRRDDVIGWYESLPIVRAADVVPSRRRARSGKAEWPATARGA